MKKTPIINKLDKIFSEYVRRYYADHTGWVQCATCEKGGQWKGDGMDNGHFMSRRHKSVRWDFRNCLPQCKGCNRYDQGRQWQMGRSIDRIHGEGTADKMEYMSENSPAPSIPEMLEMIEFYKKKLDKLL